MVVKCDLVVQTVPYATKIAFGQNLVSGFANLVTGELFLVWNTVFISGADESVHTKLQTQSAEHFAFT